MRLQPMSSFAIPTPTTRPPLIGSFEQEIIWNAVVSRSDNLLINAVAGSGKSTTCIESARRMQRDSRTDDLQVLYLAFNKHIQVEMQQQAGTSLTAMTYHSLGFTAIKNCYGVGHVSLDKNRMWKVIANMREWSTGDRGLMSGVKTLAGLAKQYDASSKKDLEFLVDHHGLSLGNQEQEQQIVSLVPLALEKAAEFKRGTDITIDFDDMGWLPCVLDLNMPQYDLALSDESQDLNRVQQWAATRVSPRLMIVGDRNQAIYGFRGAESNSMDKLASLVTETGRPPVSYPLSYTRRCSQRVVWLAQGIVPGIQALPTAPEGSTGLVNYGTLLDKTIPGDMVLCRTNAPLIECAYKLLRMGKKARIKGTDIVVPIKKLLSDALKLAGPAASLERLLSAAQGLTDADIRYFLDLPNRRGEQRAFMAEDRLQCLKSAAEGCQTKAEVEKALDTMFSDHIGDDSIQLGTIHKMKGLEADRVFVLRPDLLPHPMATKEHAIEQEMNCLYVAITRARKELYFVGGWPAPLEEWADMV